MSDWKEISAFFEDIKINKIAEDEQESFNDALRQFLAAAAPDTVYSKGMNQIGPACELITAFFAKHMIKENDKLKKDIQKLGDSPSMHDYWTLYSFAKYWESEEYWKSIKEIELYKTLFELKKCYNLVHHAKSPLSESKNEKAKKYGVPHTYDGKFHTMLERQTDIVRIKIDNTKVDKEFDSFAKTNQAALKYLQVTYDFFASVLTKCGYTVKESVPEWIEPMAPAANMEAQVQAAVAGIINKPIHEYDKYAEKQHSKEEKVDQRKRREGQQEQESIGTTETITGDSEDINSSENNDNNLDGEPKFKRKRIGISLVLFAALALVYSFFMNLDTSMLDNMKLSDSIGECAGDNYGSRNFYTKDEINSDILGDEVTFNSIVDANIGDERNFVGAKSSVSRKGKWEPDTVSVKDGDIYTVCIFVKNDNPNGINAVATGVNAWYSIPTNVDTEHWIFGYLDCANAKPKRCWDGVKLVSEEPVYLEYIDDSARFYNSEMDGIPLSNDIISKGVPLGFDRFDGNIPGGDKYQGLVTVDVEVHKSVTAKLSVKVRLDGTDSWNEFVYANVGDTVEYDIEYKNYSNDKATDIMIRDILPDNIAYINGSTCLYNSDYQEGKILENDDIAGSGINIGDYNPKGSANVRFKGKIVDDSITNDNWQLINWASATIWEAEEEYDLYKDDASVFVAGS